MCYGFIGSEDGENCDHFFRSTPIRGLGIDPGIGFVLGEAR
ncbi:MAG: hypothetical protein RL117_1694 [Verrucomicrobiota bacterium]|jgi:ElaB/YqjD/DUF883 family membrane-anchored ribosome-binding protein